MGINLVEILYVQVLWFKELLQRWKARSIINKSAVSPMKDGLKKHVGDAKNRGNNITNTTCSKSDIFLAEGDV